jgi:formyltetrahydrofolate deformylase
MSMVEQRYRLLMACPDEKGLIHRVAGVLAQADANIVAFDQHSEGLGGHFFMRSEFDARVGADARIRHEMESLSQSIPMQWRLTQAHQRQQLAILVSREAHCLQELVWQTGRGDIEADIAVVISNHAEIGDLVHSYDLPFYHVEVVKDHKRESERQMLDILARYQIDTIVLARYMQILSAEFVSQYPWRIINIHHSFLPAFVGANPYLQAYRRGVKLIGGTAHYVTKDLDQGPIIEQDVHRVDHRHQLADYKRIGRHVERMVLARAVTWHVTDRVLVRPAWACALG